MSEQLESTSEGLESSIFAAEPAPADPDDGSGDDSSDGESLGQNMSIDGALSKELHWGGSILGLGARMPVQLMRDGHTGLDDAGVQSAATHGLTAIGGTLPHLEAIQRSFGAHDISGISAHVGGAARDASAQLGAHAYATGNHVAFAEEPSLFLAAHEAAHVVQQRGGVQLSSAVGEAGDSYEQNADAVAARVVAGESAEDLLGPVNGGSASIGSVQRATTKASGIQPLSRVVLNGSAYLGESVNGPFTYENQFGGGVNSTSSVLLMPGYQGMVRVHLTGTAELQQAFMPLPMPVPLDLVAAWSVDDAGDGRWNVDFDSTVLRETLYEDGSLELGVENEENPLAFKDHPGSVTLKITPRYRGSLPDLSVGPLGVKLGDCELNPLTFKVTLYARGEDPRRKPIEATRTAPPKPSKTINNTFINNSGVVEVPPVPSDIEETWVRFDVGQHTPSKADNMLDVFVSQYDEYSKPPVDIDRRVRNSQYHINVMGHASTTGTPEKNKELADQRAAYVAGELATSLGLKAATDSRTHPITAGNRGEKNALQKTGDNVEHEDWRVAKIYVKRLDLAEPGLDQETKQETEQE